jgi:phosphate-selective porin OprO/OprP
MRTRNPTSPRIGASFAALAIALVAPASQAQDDAFSVGGYLHYDTRHFHQRASDSAADVSEVRRLRPQFRYTSDTWSVRLMPDLMRETNQVLDAYVDITPSGPWDLRVGRFKTPLSLNRLQSVNALAVMENSVVAAMTPNRDNGVLLGFEPHHEGGSSWRLEAGVFDGAADDEVKGSLDGGAELTLRALRTQALGNGRLRFGIGASGGHRRGTPDDPRLARARTPGQTTWFRYAARAYSDGQASRTVAFADYHGGPWFVQAEAIRSVETVRLGAGYERIGRRGWELQASRVLSGEDRTAEGVRPANLKVPGIGLPVAVELGVRVAEVRVDREAFALGFADPATSGDRLRSAGVSMALWFPRQWRLQVDYEHSRIRRQAGARDTGEKVLMARAIVVF